MRAGPVSTTYAVSPETDTEEADKNCADAPVPLLNPTVLLPAIVVTDPVAMSIERNAEMSATTI
jgi:hypothetical protein